MSVQIPGYVVWGVPADELQRRLADARVEFTARARKSTRQALIDHAIESLDAAMARETFTDQRAPWPTRPRKEAVAAFRRAAEDSGATRRSPRFDFGVSVDVHFLGDVADDGDGGALVIIHAEPALQKEIADFIGAARFGVDTRTDDHLHPFGDALVVWRGILADKDGLWLKPADVMFSFDVAPSPHEVKSAATWTADGGAAGEGGLDVFNVFNDIQPSELLHRTARRARTIPELAIAALRPSDHREDWGDTTCPVALCSRCGQPWPCETERAEPTGVALHAAALLDADDGLRAHIALLSDAGGPAMSRLASRAVRAVEQGEWPALVEAIEAHLDEHLPTLPETAEELAAIL